MQQNEIKFKDRIIEVVTLLGGQSDIVSSISSWHSTLSDNDVIESIDLWIEAKIKEQKNILKYVQSHRK